jgi:hypothetical protein
VPERLEPQIGKMARTVDEIIDDMTLFDDDLMSMVFDENIEATELLLKIILNQKDIRVISVTGQKELKFSGWIAYHLCEWKLSGRRSVR